MITVHLLVNVQVDFQVARVAFAAYDGALGDAHYDRARPQGRLAEIKRQVKFTVTLMSWVHYQ